MEKALAGCFVAAGVVAALAALRALHAILAVVPDSIKLAVVVGMGLLLSFIGLQSSKVSWGLRLERREAPRQWLHCHDGCQCKAAECPRECCAAPGALV